jgi:hypothetical protein
LKLSALAHTPLQIKAKTKQSARFYSRDVRRLMRGGAVEGDGGLAASEAAARCLPAFEHRAGNALRKISLPDTACILLPPNTG